MSKKDWQPFGPMECPETGERVSGRILVNIHVNVVGKDDVRVPIRMECSGTDECGVEPNDCPIFKAFKT